MNILSVWLKLTDFGISKLLGKMISLLCSNTYLQMVMASPGWQAVQKMKLARLVDRIGEDWIFLTVGEAVEACLSAHKSTALEC